MKSLKSQLLIARPELDDPNFARSVLILLEHSEGGALGVILNRPTEATVTDLAEQVLDEPFDWEKPIHLGGPVPGPLIVLHTLASSSDQTVLDGVYSTVDAQGIRELIQNRVEPSLIIANYAGWGPGQLDKEFATDSWYTVPAEPGLVFQQNDESDLWERLVKQVHAEALSAMLHLGALPADPSVN